MDLQTQKLKIIQQVLETNDQLLLNLIMSILEYDLKTEGNTHEAVTDFWNELTLELKDKIEQSILELSSEKGIPHGKVMEEFRVKYKR